MIHYALCQYLTNVRVVRNTNKGVSLTSINTVYGHAGTHKVKHMAEQPGNHEQREDLADYNCKTDKHQAPNSSKTQTNKKNHLDQY